MWHCTARQHCWTRPSTVCRRTETWWWHCHCVSWLLWNSADRSSSAIIFLRAAVACCVVNHQFPCSTSNSLIRLQHLSSMMNSPHYCQVLLLRAQPGWSSAATSTVLGLIDASVKSSMKHWSALVSINSFNNQPEVKIYLISLQCVTIGHRQPHPGHRLSCSVGSQPHCCESAVMSSSAVGHSVHQSKPKAAQPCQVRGQAAWLGAVQGSSQHRRRVCCSATVRSHCLFEQTGANESYTSTSKETIC